MLANFEHREYKGRNSVWAGRYENLHNLPHWHMECELLYIEKDQVTVSLNNTVYHLKKGDAFFIDSKDIHYIKGSESSITEIIMFDSRILEEIAKEQFAKIEEVKMSDAEKRRGIRAFTKSFVLAEEDTQGRVVLPANLREFAHIKKDIVFCGVGNRAEIWAKEVYDEYFADDDTNFNEYFDSLGI